MAPNIRCFFYETDGNVLTLTGCKLLQTNCGRKPRGASTYNHDVKVQAFSRIGGAVPRGVYTRVLLQPKRAERETRGSVQTAKIRTGCNGRQRIYQGPLRGTEKARRQHLTRKGPRGFTERGEAAATETLLAESIEPI